MDLYTHVLSWLVMGGRGVVRSCSAVMGGLLKFPANFIQVLDHDLAWPLGGFGYCVALGWVSCAYYSVDGLLSARQNEW